MVIYPSAAPFTWFGWVGVEIFFVISGFVIANSACKSSPGEFLLGRALRLYPAVWVCATATLLVLLIFGSGPASEFILPYIHAMLLVPKGVTGEWLDGVYWTLAAETAFYGLVFCAMLTKKITLRHLAFGLTIYSAVFNAVALAGSVVHDAIRFDLSHYSDVSGAVRGIPTCSIMVASLRWASGSSFPANRELTALERVAVAVTCLSGAAEIYYFASFFLTSIPAIADQSALVPIMVWAAAVLLIAFAANRNRNRHAAGIASAEAPAYWRTLGLITYPFYLMHNVVGTAIIRTLVDAGLDATTAVWIQLGILVLVCWFICAKVEPVIRAAMTRTITYFGQLPERLPKSTRPRFSRGLGLRQPAPAKMIATLQ